MDTMNWLLKNALNIIGGTFIALVSYLAEIRYSIYVMWSAMFFDLIFGLFKSRLISKERFQMSRFREWMVFVIAATVLVVLVYSTEVEIVRSKYALDAYSWFMLIITGFVISSIIRNVERLTNKYVFTALLNFINDKIKMITGVNLSRYEKNYEKSRVSETKKRKINNKNHQNESNLYSLDD